MIHINTVMMGSCTADTSLEPTILSPLVISCDLFVLSGEFKVLKLMSTFLEVAIPETSHVLFLCKDCWQFVRNWIHLADLI